MNERIMVVVSTIIGFTILIISIWVSYWIFNIEDKSFLLTARIDTIVKALTAIGLLSGGLIGLINVYFGAKRAYAMEKTAEAANKNAEAANRNAQAAIDKQITDRFSKAIEQLGSEKIEIRWGAIYTLERIARDSKNDYWTVIEVLTAFIRQNSPVETIIKGNFTREYLHKNEDVKLSKPKPDIQEAFTVIMRCYNLYEKENKKLNLSYVNFSQLNLVEAQLSGADLRGANFKGTYFYGANLEGANLNKADLTGVILTKANLTKANLTEANFTHSYLIGTNFTEAILGDVNFTNAILIGTNFTKANLCGSIFRDAELRGFYVPGMGLLESANFNEASILLTDFSDNTSIKPAQIKAAKDWRNAKYDKEFYISHILQK